MICRSGGGIKLLPTRTQGRVSGQDARERDSHAGSVSGPARLARRPKEGTRSAGNNSAGAPKVRGCRASALARPARLRLRKPGGQRHMNNRNNPPPCKSSYMNNRNILPACGPGGRPLPPLHRLTNSAIPPLSPRKFRLFPAVNLQSARYPLG